jgi:hypothetical protein
VIIDDFGLGRMRARNLTFMISADPDLGKGENFSGLLAPNLMGKFDIELDMAAHKLNYFSPDHCQGHVVYWPASAIAAVPMTFFQGHIEIPVTLDGHTMTADIDTGSSTTTITADAAKRLFEVTADSADVTPVSTIDGQKVVARVFHSLAFEGIAINNPRITIYPNLVGSHDFSNSRQMDSLTRHEDDLARFPELTIGMNTLRNLHIYIAFAERMLYLTPASPPSAPDSGSKTN